MNTKGSDDGGPWVSNSVGEAFSSPLVLRQIFKYLKLEHLKTYGLVNKSLNFQVRSYIRDFRKCMAYKKNESLDECYLPCVQLKELNQVLTKWKSSSSAIPFTGIKINLVHDVGVSNRLPKCEEYIDANFKEIIKLIPLRRLVVIHDNSTKSGTSKIPNSCPVIPFLRRWISLQNERLEEVELMGLPLVVCKQLEKMRGLEMPKLKTLELSFARNCNSSVRRNTLATFCANAPNLKKLQAPVDYSTLVKLPESLYKRIEQFNLTRIANKSTEKHLRLLAQHEPTLRQLGLESIPVDETNEFYGTFKSIFQHLIQSSQSSLEVLCIEIINDKNLLVHLRNLIAEPITSVKVLKFSTKARDDRWFPLIDNFNFSLFPAVTHVSVNDYAGDHHMLLTYFVDTSEPHGNPAVSVTSLDLNIACDNVRVEYLQRIFPNVTKLRIKSGMFETPFGEIWACWSNLEELAVNEGEIWESNFDADMCGIFQEEADYLHRQSMKYLQTVQIVPVRPAITTMSKLKTLWIEVDDDPGKKYSSVGMELFSHLTCHLVLKRMTNLKVVINCEKRNAFSAFRHLKSHVSFTTEKRMFEE